MRILATPKLLINRPFQSYLLLILCSFKIIVKMTSSSLTMDFIRKSLEESSVREIFSIEENWTSLLNLLGVILSCLFKIFLLYREAEYNVEFRIEAQAEDESSSDVDVAAAPGGGPCPPRGSTGSGLMDVNSSVYTISMA